MSNTNLAFNCVAKIKEWQPSGRKLIMKLDVTYMIEASFDFP